MAEKNTETPEISQKSPKRVNRRSPAYPGVDLKDSLDLAERLYKIERDRPVPVNIVLGHWGFKPKNSKGLITLAALKKFGLLNDSGKGDNRKASLTPLAVRLIEDQREDTTERDANLRRAALNPTIHKELWNEYDGKLPSDATLRYNLKTERGFTDRGVQEFIQEFRRTIAFSNLGDSVILSEDDSDKSEAEESSFIKKPAERMDKIPPCVGEVPKVTQRAMQDSFSLTEGTALLQWPNPLSEDSVADLKGYLTITLSKIERMAKAVKEEKKESPSQEDE